MKRVLVGAGIILLALIALLLVVGLIVPQEITVSRQITINAPADAVFRQMSCFRNWKNWSPWYRMDTAAQIEYGGSDCGPGSSYSWKGTTEKTGSGQMKVNSLNGTEMNFEVNFNKPRSSHALGILKAQSSNGGTLAIWIFRVHIPYPFNGIALLMSIDKMLGKDFESGLTNLKAYVENPANH